MKPYLGILIDSFWEAIGNKVLWALLIGWTGLLLCIVPFGYVGENSYLLVSYDIDDRSELIAKLAKGAQQQGPLAGQVIAGQLDEEFQLRLARASKKNSSERIRSSELAEALNDAVKAPELFSPEAFPTAERRKELKALIDQGVDQLSQEEVEQLNRHLLRLAFPLEISSPRGEQLWLGYAGFKIGNPLPFTRKKMGEYFEPIVLQVIIKLGLAIVAVFVAIIVTSPIIPETFRSGSLHLLLSKPISRVWLYLSKFFGGTIFVLVNITFVLVGLYIIAGTRFGIWNEGLLYCIPILVFVFVIFYSVSGLAGLLWGNAIVCVVSCMLFWFGCMVLGVAKGAIQPHAEIFPQIHRIELIDDRVTVVNEKGDFAVWNEEFSVWQPALQNQGGGQSRTFGPIYDRQRQRLYVKSFVSNPFGGSFARSRELQVIELADGPGAAPEKLPTETGKDEALGGPDEPAGEAVTPEPTAAPAQDDAASETDSVSAPDESAAAAVDEPDNQEDAVDSGDSNTDSPADGAAERKRGPSSQSDARKRPVWQADPGPELPQQLFSLHGVGGLTVAVCRSGLYRLNADKLDIVEAGEKALFGFKLPWALNNAFEKISPSDFVLSPNSKAAVTQAEDGFVVYSSGKLDRLELVEDKLVVRASVDLAAEDDEFDRTAAALVAMNDAFCVLVRDDEPIQLLDANLAKVGQVSLPEGEEVKQLAWVPGRSQLSLVSHTGGLWLLDCSTQTLESPSVPHAGSLTTICWVNESQAWIGVQPQAAYLVNIENGSVERELVPAATVWERIYFLGVAPLYRILPKPAALDDAMLYLLSDNRTQDLNIVTNDLGDPQLELDIWSPVLSNLAFVVGMLAGSCVYVARKEF